MTALTPPSRYRRSLAERLTNLSLAWVALIVGVGVFALSGPFWAPLGLAAAVVGVLASLAFVWLWVRSREVVQWRESERGLILVKQVGGREESVSVDDVVAVRVVPCALHTTVVTTTGRLTLSHKLLQFEALLARLRSVRPDLFPAPADELRLTTTRVGLVVLLLLAAGTALAGVVLEPYQSWLLPLFGGAAVVPLIRILLFFPLEYRIAAGRLSIRFVLRWQRLDASALTQITSDVYAAAGAVFYLLRLEFRRGRVILDEGHLRSSVRPFAEWIRSALI